MNGQYFEDFKCPSVYGYACNNYDRTKKILLFWGDFLICYDIKILPL